MGDCTKCGHFIYSIWPKFGLPNFFFKNLAPSVTRCHGQLSSCIIEKTNDPILRKLSDRRTDRRTDRQTDRQMDDGQTRPISQDAVRLTSSVQHQRVIFTFLKIYFKKLNKKKDQKEFKKKSLLPWSQDIKKFWISKSACKIEAYNEKQIGCKLGSKLHIILLYSSIIHHFWHFQ